MLGLVSRQCSNLHGETERWDSGGHFSCFIQISCLSDNPQTKARSNKLVQRWLLSLGNLISTIES